MIRFFLPICVLLTPLPAQALLLCLGNEQRFSFVSDGQTAQFDYVGDGTFDLSAPLPLPLDGPAESTLGTHVPIHFVVAPAACEVFGVTQSLTIELTILSNGAEVVFTGCCSDRRSAPGS